MKILLSVVLIFFVSGQANAYDIKAYCQRVADAVGGSYQIENTCREQEYEAQSRLGRMQVPTRIDNYCRKVGQAVGGSYQIMETCIQQEIEAKGRLR